jgi:hypothetical protein
MRFLLAPFVAAVTMVMVLRLAVAGQDAGTALLVLFALLIGFATIDWLVTRHLEVMNPVRVYLLLAAGALVVAYGVYLFSYLGPVRALTLAVGLGLAVGVLTLVRRPHTRRAREAAGLCVECGYDLRASTERCPECNAPLPESVTRRRRIAAEIRAARGRADDESTESAMRVDSHNIGSPPPVDI